MMGEKSLRYTVLEAYADMATKKKARVENAFNKLLTTVQIDRDYVPGLLGIANALVRNDAES